MSGPAKGAQSADRVRTRRGDVTVREVVVPFRRPLATRVGHFAR